MKNIVCFNNNSNNNKMKIDTLILIYFKNFNAFTNFRYVYNCL